MPHTKQLFRPFWDMIHHGIPEFSLDGLGDAAELVPGRGRARLFLGHYSEEAVRERLIAYSLDTRLRELGVGSYQVHIVADDPDHQEVQLHLLDPKTGLEMPEALAEIVVREAILSPIDGLLETNARFSFLVIQWIRLQNPLAVGSPRPLLPGQKYPGLGLGRKVMELLWALCAKLKLQGIINRPEFVHNALMYSRHFKFLNPVVQGRLAALERDLGSHDLWQIAWGVQKGLVLEDGIRNFFRWYQSEQVWPDCDGLDAYFQSPRYLDAVAQSASSASYAMAPGALERLHA